MGIKIKSIDTRDDIEPVTGRKLRVTTQTIEYIGADENVVLTSITELIFPKRGSNWTTAKDVLAEFGGAEEYARLLCEQLCDSLDNSYLVDQNFEWPGMPPGGSITQF